MANLQVSAAKSLWALNSANFSLPKRHFLQLFMRVM